ncbi:hypothetical protein GZ78_01555 [Endozoicomonas numazuensis]|uniref:Endonuclease/exonuclease/phosphatase domain-containing protein n=2 Tax=Endozoicomonas numazuensis TaxID=1137799 RepID=A0A081NK27_9GAMM|nr:hypothetical protein GZ78_01555 [Endozoicomonas numazuensis]
MTSLSGQTEVIPGGQFSVVTYNVAGLPSWINDLDTDRFDPMGEKLNAFDIVLVQEDFWYHDLLTANMDFPYMSPPKINTWGEWLWLYLVNDGLNRFSRFPMSEVKRHPWDSCHDYNVSGGNGSDCFARKGFSFASHTLTAENGEEVRLDIYNLHMESSHTDEGNLIRAAQVEILAEEMQKLSGDNAVILVGDFNFSKGRMPGLYQKLIEATELTDAFTALRKTDKWTVDRIFFRSSKQLKLTPVKAQTLRFNENGMTLSDHSPKMVQFNWRLEE